jgi:hypothetical protein
MQFENAVEIMPTTSLCRSMTTASDLAVIQEPSKNLRTLEAILELEKNL